MMIRAIVSNFVLQKNKLLAAVPGERQFENVKTSRSSQMAFPWFCLAKPLHCDCFLAIIVALHITPVSQ